MADKDESTVEASAEKAYAAAAEAVSSKPAPEQPAEAQPIVFPPAEKRAAEAAPAKAAAKPKPAAKTTPAKPRKPAKPAVARRRAVASSKKGARPVKAAAAKPKSSVTAKSTTHSQIKEKPMTKTATKTAKAPEGLKKVFSETQDKAKQTFDKTAAMLGEYGEFTKGNVEALVESGKILATGLQGMGTEMVAEGRTAFETMTSDVKELASVKSPTDFVKLQTEIMRRNIDSAVTYGSKNSEAMLKLANEAFAPISGRFSLAMEKIRKAA